MIKQAKEWEKGTTHGGFLLLSGPSAETLRRSKFRARCLNCNRECVVSYNKLVSAPGRCRSCYNESTSGQTQRYWQKIRQDPAKLKRQLAGMLVKQRKANESVVVVECCRSRHCEDCAGTNRTVKLRKELKREKTTDR